MALVLLILAQGFGASDRSVQDDPAARAAVERMERAYGGLRTFRCFAVGRVGGDLLRAELFFERAGRSLVRALEPRRDGTLAEARAWGRKLVLWSPRDPRRYVRTTLDAARNGPRVVDSVVVDPPDTAFAQVAAWTGLKTSGVAELLEGPRPPSFLGGIVRDGGRAVAADGTPVVVVHVLYEVFYATGRRAWSGLGTVLQIGVADGLLHRVEIPNTVRWDFRQVRADAPLPASAFAFRPPRGARPLGLPWEDRAPTSRRSSSGG